MLRCTCPTRPALAIHHTAAAAGFPQVWKLFCVQQWPSLPGRATWTALPGQPQLDRRGLCFIPDGGSLLGLVPAVTTLSVFRIDSFGKILVYSLV
jgi:hypothetical protein